LVTVRAVTVEFFVSIVITFCSQTFVAWGRIRISLSRYNQTRETIYFTVVSYHGKPSYMNVIYKFPLNYIKLSRAEYLSNIFFFKLLK
jgi:hypothetical protein